MSVISRNVLRVSARGATHVLQTDSPCEQNLDHFCVTVRTGNKERALLGAIFRERIGPFGEEKHELVQIVVL